MLYRASFQLRSLIALVTVSAVIIGIWAHEYHKQIGVAVATKELTPGNRFAPDNYRFEKRTKRLIAEYAVTDVNELIDQVAMRPISSGEILTKAKLVDEDAFTPAGGIPIGRRVTRLNAYVVESVSVGDIVEVLSWDGEVGFLAAQAVEVFAINGGKSTKREISVLCWPETTEIFAYESYIIESNPDVEFHVRHTDNRPTVTVRDRRGRSLKRK